MIVGLLTVGGMGEPGTIFVPGPNAIALPLHPDEQRNVISGNAGDGISIDGAQTNNIYVTANRIGTNTAGNADLGNTGVGVSVTGGATQVGIGRSLIQPFLIQPATEDQPEIYLVGLYDAAQGNIISGNDGGGVVVSGAGNGVDISGNTIGLGSNGQAIGNTGVGVRVTGGSHGINIGVPLDLLDGSYDPLGGNVISGNSSHGVLIDGAETNLVLVSGNKIGTRADGNTDLGNGGDGVRVENGAFSVVVGMLVGQISNGTESLNIPLYPDDSRNIISGNSGSGVSIDGSGTHDVYVTNNRIGTNASGTSDLGNSGAGVSVTGGATNVGIGRSLFNAILFQGSNGDPDVSIQGAYDVAQGNLISGNDGGGVVVSGASTQLVSIAGNKIGTNAAGTSVIGNSAFGIKLTSGAHDVTVGVPINPELGIDYANIIGGNQGDGVTIQDYWSYSNQPSNNVVAGNFIGTDSTGLLDLGNSQNGVQVARGVNSVRIGNNVDGNASGTVGNVIAFNHKAGVSMLSTANTAGTNVSGNVIRNNYVDGIRLDGANRIVIGGNSDSAGNRIYSNTGNGIILRGFSANTRIAANLIGTTEDGLGAAGNTGSGISIESAWGTTIGMSYESVRGGLNSAYRNVISANGADGIRIENRTIYNTQVIAGVVIGGNYIGVNATGTADLGNIGAGVSIGANINGVVPAPSIRNVDVGMSWRSTGSYDPMEGNIVSGNGGDGIVVGPDALQVNIMGNKIGIAVDGQSAIGNDGAGVQIDRATRTTIGDLRTAARRNTIAYNGQAGVSWSSAVGTSADQGFENRVYGNSIFSNELSAAQPKGIEAQSNNAQSAPVIAFSTISYNADQSKTVTVTFQVPGGMRPQTIVAFYFADAYGQGKTYIGNVLNFESPVGSGQFFYAVTDPNSTTYINQTPGLNVMTTFQLPIGFAIPTNPHIVATVTHQLTNDSVRGNTSEFSASVSVTNLLFSQVGNSATATGSVTLQNYSSQSAALSAIAAMPQPIQGYTTAHASIANPGQWYLETILDGVNVTLTGSLTLKNESRLIVRNYGRLVVEGSFVGLDTALVRVESGALFNTKGTFDFGTTNSNDSHAPSLQVVGAHVRFGNNVQFRNNSTFTATSSIVEMRSAVLESTNLFVLDHTRMQLLNSEAWTDPRIGWAFFGNTEVTLNNVALNRASNIWTNASDNAHITAINTAVGCTIGDHARYDIYNSPSVFFELFLSNGKNQLDLYLPKYMPGDWTQANLGLSADQGINYEINIHNSSALAWALTLKPGFDLTVRGPLSATSARELPELYVSVIGISPWKYAEINGSPVTPSTIDAYRNNNQIILEDASWSFGDEAPGRLRYIHARPFKWSTPVSGKTHAVFVNSELTDPTLNSKNGVLETVDSNVGPVFANQGTTVNLLGTKEGTNDRPNITWGVQSHQNGTLNGRHINVTDDIVADGNSRMVVRDATVFTSLPATTSTTQTIAAKNQGVVVLMDSTLGSNTKLNAADSASIYVVGGTQSATNSGHVVFLNPSQIAPSTISNASYDSTYRVATLIKSDLTNDLVASGTGIFQNSMSSFNDQTAILYSSTVTGDAIATHRAFIAGYNSAIQGTVIADNKGKYSLDKSTILGSAETVNGTSRNTGIWAKQKSFINIMDTDVRDLVFAQDEGWINAIGVSSRSTLRNNVEAIDHGRVDIRQSDVLGSMIGLDDSVFVLSNSNVTGSVSLDDDAFLSLYGDVQIQNSLGIIGDGRSRIIVADGSHLSSDVRTNDMSSLELRNSTLTGSLTSTDSSNVELEGGRIIGQLAAKNTSRFESNGARIQSIWMADDGVANTPDDPQVELNFGSTVDNDTVVDVGDFEAIATTFGGQLIVHGSGSARISNSHVTGLVQAADAGTIELVGTNIGPTSSSTSDIVSAASNARINIGPAASSSSTVTINGSVVATDDGRIVIRNAHITGSLKVSGNGTIVLIDSTYEGTIIQSGSGQVIVATGTSHTGDVTSAGIQVMTVNQTLTGNITAGGTAVVVVTNSAVTGNVGSAGGELVANGGSIAGEVTATAGRTLLTGTSASGSATATGTGHILLTGSSVVTGAVSDQASLTLRDGSSVTGAVSVEDNATFDIANVTIGNGTNHTGGQIELSDSSSLVGRSNVTAASVSLTGNSTALFDNAIVNLNVGPTVGALTASGQSSASIIDSKWAGNLAANGGILWASNTYLAGDLAVQSGGSGSFVDGAIYGNVVVEGTGSTLTLSGARVSDSPSTGPVTVTAKSGSHLTIENGSWLDGDLICEAGSNVVVDNASFQGKVIVKSGATLTLKVWYGSGFGQTIFIESGANVDFVNNVP
ncbi:hypothetical protein K2X85_19035 [bacterium]|nr:hypothetical protein [bacterium]